MHGCGSKTVSILGLGFFIFVHVSNVFFNPDSPLDIVHLYRYSGLECRGRGS